MDEIINLRDFPGSDLHVRMAKAKAKYEGRTVLYVGRGLGSPLANPFREGDGDERAEVIEKYRRWIWAKIQAKDKKVLDALAEISEDAILACWCAPLPCHSNVIWKAWKWCKEQKII